MKKTLKVLLFVALIATMLFALTGCGSKLVATKTTETEDMNGEAMKYDEKIEVSFKKDKVNKVKMTYTFDNKDQAKKYVDMYNALVQLSKSMGGDEVQLPEAKQSGKSVVMTFDAKAYAEFADDDEADMTRDEIKKTLEEQGYTVK